LSDCPFYLPQLHFVVFDGFTPGVVATRAVLLSHAVTKKKGEIFFYIKVSKGFACAIVMEKNL